MRKGDILYCKVYTEAYTNNFDIVKFNIGDKCTISKISTYGNVIMNNSEYVLFSIDRIEEYFETVNEHRIRIIEDLV